MKYVYKQFIVIYNKLINYNIDKQLDHQELSALSLYSKPLNCQNQITDWRKNEKCLLEK